MMIGFRGIALLFCAVLGASCSEIRTPTLDVSASTNTLGPGQSAQLTVTRHYEGGPFENVTNRAIYTVTPRDVVTVSSAGVVTPGSQLGGCDVRITELDDAATTTVHFNVTASRLVALRIDPTLVVLAPGSSRRLIATAVLNDNTEQDVTQQVTFTSSNDEVASVGQTQPNVGLLTANAEGNATITALDPVTNVQAHTDVVVQGTVPSLAAITVTPNPAVVVAGKNVAMTATGHMTNGATVDLTTTATWIVSDSTKASVDPGGVVSGIAAGSLTITAASGAAGTVKGSAALTVQ
jgi:hypothetical protein